MLSSRCNDPIRLDGSDQTLSDLRRRLKSEIEKVDLLGGALFDVWINEDAPPAEGSVDAWDHCLKQVADADIMLVLYNGNSGWAKHGGEVGICHAEFHKALSTAPAKVRLIELTERPLGTGDALGRDERFRAYVAVQSRFRGAKAADGDEAIARCKAALRDAVADMVRLGGREARRGRFHTGDALDWSRLDFEKRRAAMIDALCRALEERSGSVERDDHLFVQIASKSILVACHAVPASMTTPGALDSVHQPFVRDHALADYVGTCDGGPVHFFACHRTVTEAQALRQLGCSDAVVVNPPFGVYVADDVQKVQMLLIGSCRDETSTRHGVQRAFEWLDQSGEDRLVAARAAARGRIIQAIARER
jgi:hypothetical protein